MQVARNAAPLGFFDLEQTRGKRLQPAMGIAQCLLRRSATGPLQAVVQGTGDHRGETLEPLLHHIIGSSRFDALDRALLSERAGDENEGDFEAALPQQAQGAQPVEARKIVIGEDQVEIGSVQERFEFLPGLHLCPGAIVAGGLKLPDFELCVEGVIFENQEFERSGHASMTRDPRQQYVKFGKPARKAESPARADPQGMLVELRRIELPTFALRTRRSPS